MIRHGSLFSGIGGFDLAAERVGWRNVYQVEIDPFCRQVLAHHFPNAKQFDDVREFQGFNPVVDVLSGGFPCQPFSNAGERRGDADPRHLWPEMFRIVRNARPRWVVAENVRGLVDWSDGLVFESVCADLETEGFEVGAFIIPACGINAPHKRERIFVVAHAPRNGNCRESGGVRGTQRRPDNGQPSQFVQRGEIRPFAHANGGGTRPEAGGTRGEAEKVRGRDAGRISQPFERGGVAPSTRGDDPGSDGMCEAQWRDFPSFDPICGGYDGLSGGLDGITFSKWRRESLKAYGNAIVPGIAERIFRTIQHVEDGFSSWKPNSPREASTQH